MTCFDISLGRALYEIYTVGTLGTRRTRSPISFSAEERTLDWWTLERSQYYICIKLDLIFAAIIKGVYQKSNTAKLSSPTRGREKLGTTEITMVRSPSETETLHLSYSCTCSSNGDTECIQIVEMR